jgi:hypothetical protein
MTLFSLDYVPEQSVTVCARVLPMTNPAHEAA